MKKIVEDLDHAGEFSASSIGDAAHFDISISIVRLGYDAGMRGRWIVSLLALLAACDDSVWIEIRVPDGLAVDEVELFLAVDRCERSGEACKGVRPAPGDSSTVAFIPGTVFEHDTDVTFVAPASGGSASFRLPASDHQLPALMAIGVLAGDNRPAVGGVTLGALDLSLGARHVIATLVPADARTHVFRWPDAADSDRATIGCAGIRQGTDPGVFLVSPDDWDCDGFANDAEVECNPLSYRAQVPADRCAKPESVAGGAGEACMLGTGSCIDGAGTTCSVDQPEICVPEHLCTQCDFPDQGCLEDAFASGPMRISCSFAVTKEGGDHYTVCGTENRAVAQLDVFAAQNLACPNSPLVAEKLFDSDPPASVLTFSTDGQLAVLEIQPVQPSPCIVGIELGGDLGLSYQTRRFPLHFSIMGSPRTIVLPLEIALEEVNQAECDAAPVPAPCTLEFAQETVFRCVTP